MSEIGNIKKWESEMYCKNAYFTVEAALVVPVVMGTMLFVIYMLLFQYNRCLMEQDIGAMVIWGSNMEVSDDETFEEKVRDRISKMYRDKYVAFELTTLNVTFRYNNFAVEGGGCLIFPFAGWNFWSTDNRWEIKADYQMRRTSPITFIRLCRKAADRMEQGSEVEAGSADIGDGKESKTG